MSSRRLISSLILMTLGLYCYFGFLQYSELFHSNGRAVTIVNARTNALPIVEGKADRLKSNGLLVHGRFSPASPTKNLNEDQESLDQRKLEVLTDIETRTGDNDPRLDSELHVLSLPLQARLRERYFKLPYENFNDRGRIVFLLQRQRGTQENQSFFRAVLNEESCRSQACSPAVQGGHDPALAVTLVYPQIRSLQALGIQAQAADSLGLEAREILKDAMLHPNPIVSEKAKQILQTVRL